MKKYLFILTAILLTVLGSQLCAQNVMTLSSGEGRPQDIVEIELSVTNTNAFIAFQTEIPLGENLSYVEGSAVLYRNEDHQLIASVVDDVLKIYSYSFSSSEFEGSDGKIVSFKVKLGNEPGNFLLQNTKAKLADAAGNELPLSTISGNINIITPKIEIITPNIDYGHVPIRNTYTQSLGIRNIGNDVLKVSELLFLDATLSCPTFEEKYVEVGNTAFFSIVYSPYEAGAVNHKITIVSDASNGNQSINVMADPYSVNELHLAKTSAFCDSIIDISISVNNMDALTGFQFCIKMPEALQYQNNSFALTERKDDHVAFASMRNDTLVILAYSPSNSFFADNDGVIANFKVKVKGNSGTYYIYPNNTILTNAEAQNVLSSANYGYVTVKSPKINVNTTYELEASSVTEIASELFQIRNNGNAPLRIDSVKFTNEYLSTNSVFPLVISSYNSEYINIICNKDTEGAIQGTMKIYSNDPTSGLMLVKIQGQRYEPNGLVINYDEITDSKYLDVFIGLDNYSDITAIQADFSFSNEYHIASTKDVSLTERCSEFTKTVATINDTTAKLLVFSMYNELISGNEGTICKIRLTKKDDAVDKPTASVSLKNIVLSDVKGNNKNTSGNQMKYVDLMSDAVVNINPINSGSVTGAGTYHKGTNITLTATPNIGYRFVNWTENNEVNSEESEYSFIITTDRNLVANFTLLDYDVTATVNIENSGVVAGFGNYYHGDEVTLTATPNIGYRFVNWTENNEVVSEESEYSFVITNDRNLVANFTLLDYDVTASVNIENSGVVSGEGNYYHGDKVTLTAAPNIGYRFVNWTENNEVISEESEYSFIITSDRNIIANFTLLDYDVIATVNIENSGAVSGTGNYYHGDEVTLTATPNIGYRFVNWTENNEVVSEESEYSFIITTDRNIVANFTLLDYDVTATVNIENSGAVTGFGNYYHGDVVTLTATPNIGYRFVNWTENNEVLSEESEYSFIITNDRNLVANFTLLDYDVDVVVYPANSGVVSGEGNYYHGDEVTLTAVPNVGYRFVNWTENGEVISDNVVYTFIVAPDRNIVANFTLLDYDITTSVNIENSGSVTGAGNYTHGDEVILTATPNENYRFVNWTENNEVVSEESEYSFIITTDRNLVANFTLLDYDVDVVVHPANSGVVSGEGNYYHGDEVTLTAVPNIGYRFVNWTENNSVVSEESKYSFIITSDRNLVANFTLLDYDVTASVNIENSGVVAGFGNYYYGDEVTLTAVPNIGYRFVNWTENNEVISEESEYSFIITSDRNIVANFTLLDYDVTTTVNIENSGSITGAGNYYHGDEVSLTATPNVGYRFVNWTENNEVVSEESEYTFIITTDRNLVANFTLLDYDVTATVSPENSGIVAGAGNYLHGDEVSLTATPNIGYSFVNWTENNEVVSEESEYSFIITSDRNIVANFTLLTYDVTITMDIENAGVGTGEGNYSHGDNVTVNVTPNEGYKFVNWTENGEVVSTDAEYTFIITSNRDLVANFELLTYDVQLTVNPENAGVTLGTGNYIHCDSVTVKAIANNGYRFVNWTENNEVVSEESEYSFIITTDRKLVANFTLIDYDVTATVNIENSGVVSGEGNYYHGDEVVLTAIPNLGYKFINWTENDIFVSSEAEYRFTVTSDRNLVANFISTENIETILIDSFNVYPNPANINNEINLGKTFDKVEVYNSVGVKIIEYTNVDKIDGIETSGVYLIRVYNGDNVGCCRVVVN